MAWSVDWSVEVDGEDISGPLANYLISISVTDKAGAASDSCRLVLDDTGGRLRLPQPGAKVLVKLNGVQVFSGVVEKPRASGSRGGGRLLTVTAKGFDVRGKAKEPQQIHQDDGTIGDFLKKVAKKAGFSLTVDPALGNIVRDYLVADGESLLHAGEKLARELGGTFKLRGTEAILSKMGANYGLPKITGTFLPLAAAALGQAGAGSGGGQESGNVISYDIEPLSSREVFKKARVEYFDRETGEVKAEEAGTPAATEEETVNLVRSPARTKEHAKEIAEGRGRETERNGGTGRVVLDLDPTAQAEALFELKGTRPGVDGTYRIVTVNHDANRSGGSTTSLDLKQPQDGAGKDARPEPGGDADWTGRVNPDYAGETGGSPVAGGSVELVGAAPGDGPE